MPNRIIRDWTDSERINSLSFQAETLFVRLMMKADDLGSYHANPKLIKSFCFPLKNIRETDITRWLQELVTAGIIVLYNADNKQYLHIINFGQRLRQVKPKFPQIPKNELDKFILENCQQYVSNMSADCPLEEETEEEEEEEIPPIPPKGQEVEFPNSDFEKIWKEWIDYRKEIKKSFKSIKTEQIAVNQWLEKSGGDLETAKAIIMQSIGNGWTGLFELKHTPKNLNGGFEFKPQKLDSSQIDFSKIDI